MYNSSINNSLILRYKIKFSRLHLIKKQVNTVIRYLNFNDNIFLELFNDKNLFMFNKNKFLLNNIKKYYHYRLAYFFFKKNIFFSFWFFNFSHIILKNRFFFFNLFNIIFFKNFFLFKLYTFNIISFFFFSKQSSFNLLNLGFKGFIAYSHIFYTKVHFRNLNLLSVHGANRFEKFLNPHYYRHQRIYYSFLPLGLFIKNNDNRHIFRARKNNYNSFSKLCGYKNFKRYKKFKNSKKFKKFNLFRKKKKLITSISLINNKVKKNNTYISNFVFDLNIFNFFVFDFNFINNKNIPDILIFNIIQYYINNLYFFWLLNYKYIYLNSSFNLHHENEIFNLESAYYIRSVLMKLRFSKNNIFFTNYNFIKFFSFCFSNFFNNKFYYLDLNAFSIFKKFNYVYFKFKFNKFKFKSIILTNNLNLNLNYSFLFKDMYLLKFANTVSFSLLLLDSFFFWKTINFYILKKNLINAVTHAWLANYRLTYLLSKKTYVVDFFKYRLFLLKLKFEPFFILEDYDIYCFFTKKTILFNTMFNNISNLGYNYKYFTYANIILKNKLVNIFSKIDTSFDYYNLFLNAAWFNKYAANLLKRYKILFFFDFSYIKSKLDKIWFYKIKRLKIFRILHLNHAHRFSNKLLFLTKYFDFLKEEKTFFLKKQEATTLLNFKKFDFYLGTSNKLYLLLSGNFSLFNFFNFYDFFFKYYWNFRYNFNFWISTFSFKKLNIILKYFIKKNILKFNKRNKNKIFNTHKNSISFFNVAASCYNYLFLEKTKLFYLKNNLRSFIKKYKKSFCLRLRKLRFFTYLNKSFYGFNFFFKINKWYLDFTNEFNYEFIFFDAYIYHLCELFLKILLKFNLINFDFSNLIPNSTVNNVFYYDFYYKYKQLFFFLGNQLIDTNSAILNSFNFSLFLYNKNYNWFFFNYFWKWYFINIIFKNNIIYSLPKINSYNNFLSDNFIFAKDNNNIVNFFFKFNINTTFKFNRMSILVKYILSKNLLLFDQYFWYNIFYTKIKKNIIYNKLCRHFGKLCISAKYFTFNFFNRKKKKRSKYLFKHNKFDFLKKLHTNKLFLLDKVVILVINIQLNNTFITLTDIFGNVLLKASAGLLGIKGPKRATPVATEEITNFVCQFILNNNYNFLIIRFNGVLRTRKMKSAIKAISEYNFIILRAFNYTPKAHNGIRFKKQKRL